jgi:hypothetical protein
MDYHALNNFVVVIYVLFSSQLYILVCIGKHDISGGHHGSVTWNVHLMEMFLSSNKLIFIHSTSNLYATWHDSNFKFQSFKNNAS